MELTTNYMCGKWKTVCICMCVVIFQLKAGKTIYLHFILLKVAFTFGFVYTL